MRSRDAISCCFHFVFLSDKTSKILFPVIWVFLIVLIIGVVLLSALFHNLKRKRGRYSFSPEKVPKGSDVPLSPM